ncbi:DUF2357 domain-containing protein [Paenibacillus aurantius]|uniref:DUF2357 domain-containing protein n=1 Tax=Paenibacillus aurantius TaxID=2918900 RepID=A0AA96LFE1_9BACL|nr:DUF2357 domain-containing protein [Paenibacillus aurantius]WNQ12218.1 DUF2357 domain-containing protein [Paenibacillus aurantius]
MIQTKEGWEGEVMMPFQSGMITFTIEQTERKNVKSYLYPDRRKLTESEYQRMITDILTEAAACFQFQGAKLAFDSSGFERRISIAQWDYIERSFYRLCQLFRDIQGAPLRRLNTENQWMRRENVKHVTPSLLAWSERHPSSGMTPETPVSTMLWTEVREDSFDVYENRVILRQMRELQYLLKQYQSISVDTIRLKAIKYNDQVSYWLRSLFFQKVKLHQGPIVISQVFRKHPIYRSWFSWFKQLYQFDRYTVGMKNSIPLKDTYHLYEIWVFMQMVRMLRVNDLLLDAKKMFSLEQDGLVLSLSEKKENRVRLVGGATLAYQRWFTRSTQEFMTYTHGMKPDIVLEKEGKLYVFDPKYRLDHNLPLALGEMHKYRDGIVRRSDSTRAVEEVYIITPAAGVDNTHFFEDEYRKKYRMGAYCLKSGEINQELSQLLLGKLQG